MLIALIAVSAVLGIHLIVDAWVILFYLKKKFVVINQDNWPG